MKAVSAVLASCALIVGSNAMADPEDNQEIDAATLLQEAAEPYVLLRADIAAVENGGVDSADAVRTAHQLLASHDADTLERAFLAYAAMVAADTPTFAAAIEEATTPPRRRRRNQPTPRETFLEQLQTNPATVREIEGANEAIDAILDVMARDATRISVLGESYITEAYEMQREAWARRRLPDTGPVRITNAAAFAADRNWAELALPTPLRSEVGTIRPNLSTSDSWSMGWSTTQAEPQVASNAGSMMTRALLLAARYSTDDLTVDDLQALAVDRRTNRCFESAKLNFNQCISATRTPYEEAFCIGTHGLNDISRCVGWPASAGTPR